MRETLLQYGMLIEIEWNVFLNNTRTDRVKPFLYIALYKKELSIIY